MYLAWSLLQIVFVLVTFPYFLWKGRATGKYLRTFRDRMGRLPPDLGTDGSKTIWIHAVSVGEVLVARPLLAALKKRLAGWKIVVSTTTLTGHAVAAQNHVSSDGLFFAPFDLRGPVDGVLQRIKPALLVLVETELWPRLIHQARSRGTRVALVNGRISPRSFPRYRALRFLLRRVLAEVDLFLMQADAHAERILALGAPAERVQVTGNLKYDALDSARSDQPVAELPCALGERPVWIAGSTVAGEEVMVLDAYRSIRERVPDVALVLAPRHPERFDEADALVRSAGFASQRRTALIAPWTGETVLVLDTLGELARLYPLATAVFVGGSLAPAGGHNVLEAAVAGRAVVVGPHMENFQEISDQFCAEGALIQIAAPGDLAGEITRLLTERERRETVGRKAQALVERNRGAIRRTVEALAELVS